MLEQILKDCNYVKDHSKDVKIRYDIIDSFLNDFQESKFWLSNNPFHVLDLPYEKQVLFLLVYHTIGNYCFWGNPKWEISTREGKLDGSYAMIFLILEELKKRDDFRLSYEEFQNLLKGNVEIPLLEERYQELCQLNSYLDNHSFLEETRSFNDDESLFSYLVAHFPYFEDVSVYEGRKIHFYKRAQLFTSDLLHIKAMHGIEVDTSHLIGCADYKIPQVLNCYGMLEYSEELEKKVANAEEILEGSTMEVEIRANTLVVIDYIYRKLNGKMSRIDINDSIWLFGQDKSKIKKLYHHTKTSHY